MIATMKRNIKLAILIACCSQLTACNKANINIQAYQEAYTNESGSSIAYRVIIGVTNNGINSLAFDALQGAFVPDSGTPLEQTLSERTMTGGGESSTIRIAAGKGQTFSFTSDGYTADLLKDAGNGALKFKVKLMSGGSPIVAPCVAVLPSLKNLPQYDDTNQGTVLPVTYLGKGQ